MQINFSLKFQIFVLRDITPCGMLSTCARATFYFLSPQKRTLSATRKGVFNCASQSAPLRVIKHRGIRHSPDSSFLRARALPLGGVISLSAVAVER